MASQTQGIQQLLQAEKRAAEKINEARKRKTRRLKQAKDEAQAEVEKFRHERERQFKEYENKYIGSRDDATKKIDRQTAEEMEKMQKLVNQHKSAVIDELLNYACGIEAHMHRNLRI